MKVCTDSCILGAWFAQKIPSYSLVLDMGSGTGLLMLMLAQKSNAEFHGIELNLSTYKQLKENILSSKWKKRITAFPGDLRSWLFSEKYDFIITNPPFYENDLEALTDEKNSAKHSRDLNFSELIIAIDENLKPEGSFGILLPYNRTSYFEKLALLNNFFVSEKLLIRQTPLHGYFRSVLHFSRTRYNESVVFDLTIQNENKQYSSEFIELMKDYYLHL
jgi:tRNA1Val (adenine37-N6)-methyltransferase